jgi:hypothetical protein
MGTVGGWVTTIGLVFGKPGGWCPATLADPGVARSRGHYKVHYSPKIRDVSHEPDPQIQGDIDRSVAQGV